jgi:hypothetical protein
MQLPFDTESPTNVVIGRNYRNLAWWIIEEVGGYGVVCDAHGFM